MVRYNPDNTSDGSLGPIRRRFDLILRTSEVSHDSTRPLVQLDQLPNIYFKYHGSLWNMNKIQMQKIKHSVIHEKKLSLGNCENTLEQDIFLHHIEVIANDSKWIRVRMDKLRYFDGEIEKPLICHPELQLTTFTPQGTIYQNIHSPWVDLHLVEDMSILDDKNFRTRSFGYIRTPMRELYVNSVALENVHNHEIVICNLKRGFSIGVTYSFTE